MKIAYALISGGKDYRRYARANEDERRECLMRTVAAVQAAREQVELLVFPAGFFQLERGGDVRVFAKRIAKQIASLEPEFGVVWGMDVDAERERKRAAPARSDGHPYFVGYRGARGELAIRQQVSVTAKEGASEQVAGRWGAREALLPGTSIALLVCGESWSDELLQTRAANGSRALVIAAHRNVNLHRDAAGYGKLSWHRRLDAFWNEQKIPTVLSEHTRSPARHPYAWPAKIAKPWPLADVPAPVTLKLATVA